MSHRPPLRTADVTPAMVAAETERVISTASSFSDEDLTAPSLCEGWSRGHVLSHLARNADALARVCAVATDGVADTMYDSDEARDVDIDSGAGRPVAEQVADIRSSAARLAQGLDAIRPEHREVQVERTPGGARRIPVRYVPFLRLRELVFHHVDLDAGYTFADSPDEMVEMFLAHSASQLSREHEPPGIRVTTDEGDGLVIGAGTTRVSGPRAAVLLWLARGHTDGVTFDGPVPTLPFGG